MSNGAAGDGIVWLDGDVQMGDHVVMGCAAGIMAREDRLELDDAVGIRFLDTTKEGRVEIGGIVSVAIACCDEAGVYAGAVAVPDVPPKIGDRFAGCNVDELSFDDDGYAGLVFRNVGADVFAEHIILPFISTTLCKKSKDGMIGLRFIDSQDQSPPPDSTHKCPNSQKASSQAYSH